MLMGESEAGINCKQAQENFWNDRNVSKWIVVMVAQLYKFTKIIKLDTYNE